MRPDLVSNREPPQASRDLGGDSSLGWRWDRRSVQRFTEGMSMLRIKSCP